MITNGIALLNGYVSTTGQFLNTFWSVRKYYILEHHVRKNLDVFILKL